MERESISGIAVDIGGTKIAAARVEHGVITQREQVKTDATASVDALLDQLCTLVERVSAKPSTHVGFAVTGRVDNQGVWYTVNANTLEKVTSVPLAALLEARLGQPVRVLNDALAGAIAEYQFGAGIGASRLAYITVSTGVGAGLIFDGLPLTSANGLVGHLGFTSSRHSDHACGSGRYGTLESVASGAAIARAAYELGYLDMDAKAVFDAARKGDTWAGDVVEVSALAMAESITDLVVLLAIDRVVLGGSVGQAPGYVEQVSQAQQTQPEMFRVPVVTSRLDDSVLLGALATAQI